MMPCECSFISRLPWWWHHRCKIAASALWWLHLCKWRNSGWSSILIWYYCPRHGNVELWIRVQPQWTIYPACPRLGCIHPADAGPLCLPGLGRALCVIITAPRSTFLVRANEYVLILFTTFQNQQNETGGVSCRLFLPFPNLICRNVKNCSFHLLISTRWPESRWHHKELN